MKLFFFQTLALTVEVVFIFTPDEDQVAPAVEVPHFDCSEMTENSLYALNQKRPSHIAPEELEVNYPRKMLHNRNFRKNLAIKFRVQHQCEKKHCAHHDHSRIDHGFAELMSDLVISPEECRTLAERGKTPSPIIR